MKSPRLEAAIRQTANHCMYVISRRQEEWEANELKKKNKYKLVQNAAKMMHGESTPLLALYYSTKCGNDQESIKLRLTKDTTWESGENSIEHHKREPKGQPLPSR